MVGHSLLLQACCKCSIQTHMHLLLTLYCTVLCCCCLLPQYYSSSKSSKKDSYSKEPEYKEEVCVCVSCNRVAGWEGMAPDKQGGCQLA